MLVTFLYVIIVLTLTFTVIATCFSFHRKKTDVPYAPAKKTSPPKTRTLTKRLSRKFSKTTKRSQEGPRRIKSRQTTISASHPPSSITAPSSDTKQSSTSTEMGTVEVTQTEAGKTLRVDKTQKLHSYESIKEDLGDVQLVKAKGKKTPKDVLKDCPKLEKKSSDECITESSRSYDDTLRGVESLKTDNVLSWIARTSEALVKHTKTNTETTK